MFFQSLRKFTLFAVVVLTAGLLLAACQSTESTATEAPAVEAAATEAPAAESAPVAESAAGAITFSIVADGTEARFLIDEVLMGQDKTVVGVTSLVEGELTVDPSNSCLLYTSPSPRD